MFNLNSTLIAELILFAVVVVVVAKAVLPPLRRAMDERQAVIQKGLADAETAEARLADADVEVERRLTEARRRALEIVGAYQQLADHRQVRRQTVEAGGRKSV